MNLILFEAAELERPLPRTDRRAAHILEVLHRRVGEPVDAGLINGPRGKATVMAIQADALTLAFAPGPAITAPAPITLVVGLPRPQTARDILRDATTLGVAAIHFVQTEKSDPNYARSTLWSSGEWRRHLIAGAEQAFDTRIPEITHGRTLADVAATFASGAAARIAFDNYAAATALGQMELDRGAHPVIALGPERGWSDAERALLRTHGFALAHLGARVLRAETACIAALSILRSRLGLM